MIPFLPLATSTSLIMIPQANRMRSQVRRANGKDVTGGEEELAGWKFPRANFSYFAGPQLRRRFSSTAPGLPRRAQIIV